MAYTHDSFVCPHCGHDLQTFTEICPYCHRPFFRDYIDMKMYIRDPGKEGEPNYATSMIVPNLICLIPLVVALIIVIILWFFR